jgi:hypothetical protein
MDQLDDSDKELHAISVTLSALKDLKNDERDRVLSYVLTRLNMKMPVEPQSPPAPPAAERKPEAFENPHEPKRMKDIRSFTEEKNPKSANEMAAVVAYFLQYEAGAKEHQETITRTDVEKYFHLGKFSKTKDAGKTLQNSKNAGYLESKGQGVFSLSPVGYNLVAHSLPRKTN